MHPRRSKPRIAPRSAYTRAGATAILTASLAYAGEARGGGDPSSGDAPAEVRLAWVRTEGADHCPDMATLAREVARRLGRDPFAPDARRSIDGVVSHEGTRWLARVFVRDETGALVGAREIASEAAGCEPLGAAVALAIALAIDPDAALAPPEPPPAAPPAAAPVAPANTPAAAVPPVIPVRPRRPRLPAWDHVGGVTLRFVASGGLLPNVALGFGVGTDGHLVDRFRWTASVTALPEQATTDRGFAFGLTVASLGACFDAVHQPVVSLSACAGVAAGVVHAVVLRLEPLEPGDRPWVGATLGARLHVRPVRPLLLELGVDAVAPVTRYHFDVVYTDHTDTVFGQAIVGVAAYAGAGLNFW